MLTPCCAPELPAPQPQDTWLHRLIFVDLETTGAALGRDRITEIGLVWYSANHGWQAASSLVNPGIRIPSNISQLTGISNEMVADAPAFSKLSSTVQTLLQDRIIVAHNVRFDYGFLSRELARCNQVLGQRHLCTVRLSRLLQPEFDKHNLATLVQRWQLRLDNHHRALDDAMALAQLWGHWQQRFGYDCLAAQVNKAIREVHLPPQLNLQDLTQLPDGPGVYFFYGDNDSLLYIGKSIELRTRVFSHFSDALHNSKEAQIVQQTKRIDYTACAGDMGAQLLESRLIKQHQPLYNRQLRRRKVLLSWQLNADPDGYLTPALVPFDSIPVEQAHHCYGLFTKAADALKALEGISKKNQLCSIKMGLEQRHGPCFRYQLKQCSGACCGEESAERFNMRLKLALSSLEIAWWPFDGALGVHEHHTRSDQHQWHLLYQWRYLGSYDVIPETAMLFELAHQTPFDVDSYKILQRLLPGLRPSQVQVIPLPSLKSDDGSTR